VNGKILDVLELRAQLSDEQIARLVHAFYDRVQHEPLLGPVFAARIAAHGWPAHLDKMTRFWSTILRGTDRYHGDPMAAHRALPDVTAEHFERWLALFREVADEVVPGVLADSIVQRATRMGAALQGSLGAR